MNEEQAKKLLDEFKILDLQAYPVDQVEGLIRSMRVYPICITEFHVGNVIYRIRPNEKGVPFELPADLSYKPQKYNSTFQRASSPNRTMFYGSIVPQDNLDSEIDLARVIAATEASKLIRDKDAPDGVEIVSFGKWRLVDTIQLGTIVFSDVDRNVTPYARNRARTVLELLASAPEKSEAGKLLMDFIASEFAKRDIRGDYDYLISAMFTEHIVAKGYHGVIFPSVRSEEKGMNVAIIPDAADKMRLEGVMQCTVAKEGNQIAILDSKVAWVNPGDQKLNFISLAEDLERRKSSVGKALL